MLLRHTDKSLEQPESAITSERISLDTLQKTLTGKEINTDIISKSEKT